MKTTTPKKKPAPKAYPEKLFARAVAMGRKLQKNPERVHPDEAAEMIFELQDFAIIAHSTAYGRPTCVVQNSDGTSTRYDRNEDGPGWHERGKPPTNNTTRAAVSHPNH